MTSLRPARRAVPSSSARSARATVRRPLRLARPGASSAGACSRSRPSPCRSGRRDLSGRHVRVTCSARRPMPASGGSTPSGVSRTEKPEPSMKLTRPRRVITVRLHDQTFRCYQAAVRQLERRLGEAAPTVEELIAYELSHKRSVRSICDDYLDSRHCRLALRN